MGNRFWFLEIFPIIIVKVESEKGRKYVKRCKPSENNRRNAKV